MNFRRVNWLALLALLAVAQLGCRGGGGVLKPGTGEMDLRVWVVLHPSDPFVGNADNIGSRLTREEITDIVDSLRDNADLYGINVTFIWNGGITMIRDQQLPLVGRTQSVAFWDSPDFLIYQSGFFEPNAVNIYFVGNVQPNPTDPDAVIALTGDPKFADPRDIPPSILMNDGGFESFLGFNPDFTPQLVQSYFVLEHEMAHFLARFCAPNNDTFGMAPNIRVYDEGEHAPPGSNNLLRPGGPRAFPLVIPGTPRDVNTELGQIWDRIRRGRWLQP